MTEPHHHTPTAPLELRVLEGALHGSRCAIQPQLPTRVGSGLESDIVLRSAEHDACDVVVRGHAAGIEVRVLRGQVYCAESRLAEGSDAVVPLYTRLRLGGHVVAIGEPDAKAWETLDAPAADPGMSAHGEAPTKPEPEPSTLPRPQSAAAQQLSRWSRTLLVAGGGICALSVSVFALAYTALPEAPPPHQRAQAAEAALRQAGFGQISVRPGEGGLLTVSGYLDTSAQRASVEQVLARHGMTSRLDVLVNSDVVAAVQDVFRVNGISVQASASGPGAVTVSTQEADLAKLEQTQSRARRDIPGLTALDLRNTPPPPAPETMPVVEDPGKRVASIVPGESPYVVTADGTRYFEGALLPTGHRIAAIHEREVQLERNGTTTPLRF